MVPIAPSNTWARPSAMSERRSGIGIVSETGRQPALGLLEGLALAARVVGGLVLADAPDAEVVRVRMREVPAAHRRRGPHREALGERDARALRRAQEVEQRALLGVVGAGRVAGRGPDAAVLLRDEVVVPEPFVRGVAPQLPADALVQPLRERLGQPVGERLREDRVVVVVA